MLELPAERTGLSPIPHVQGTSGPRERIRRRYGRHPASRSTSSGDIVEGPSSDQKTADGGSHSLMLRLVPAVADRSHSQSTARDLGYDLQACLPQLHRQVHPEGFSHPGHGTGIGVSFMAPACSSGTLSVVHHIV